MIYVWLAVLVLSIIAEALTTGIIAIWFAFGAVAAIICASLKLHIFIQIATFVIVSFLLLLVFIKKIRQKAFKASKTNLDAIIGSVCMVEDEIPENGKGRVNVNSQSWSAKEEKGKKIKKGEFVEILEIQGVTLLCKKKEREEN